MFSNTDLPALRPTADAGGIDLSGTGLTWQNRAELRCLSPVQILQEKLFEQPGARSGVYSESTALTRASQLREALSSNRKTLWYYSRPCERSPLPFACYCPWPPWPKSPQILLKKKPKSAPS